MARWSSPSSRRADRRGPGRDRGLGADRAATDPLLDTGISFVVPFGAHITAERFHASGVVAVVIAGLLLGHKAPIIQTAQSRIAERTSWRTIASILENTVLLLIGPQARWIIDGVSVSDSDVPGGRIAALCAATLVAVVVLRLLWVFPVRYLLVRPGIDPETGRESPATYTFIVGWAGMRGVVTLAAAFVIPEEAPYREILLLIAFTVVAGTLFLQGLTLPWFARRLRVPSPDPVADALARATLLQQASKAGSARLDEFEHEDPHGVHDLIRQRIDQRNFADWERLGTVADEEAPSEHYVASDGGRRRAGHARHRGVDARCRDPGARRRESRQRREPPPWRGVRGPRAVPGRPDAGGARLRRLPARGDAMGGAAAVPGVQQSRLLRLLTRAARHRFHGAGHPVMESAEPEEDWRWCFVHHQTA